jgi:ABC-type branched-subunit amino acid transport system ATPase component
VTINSNSIAIKAENLVKSFGSLRAVNGFSLSINKGEHFRRVAMHIGTVGHEITSGYYQAIY